MDDPIKLAEDAKELAGLHAAQAVIELRKPEPDFDLIDKTLKESYDELEKTAQILRDYLELIKWAKNQTSNSKETTGAKE